MRNLITLLVLTLFAVLSTAQESQKVDQQFNQLIEESNDFKNYKVVRKTSLDELRRSTVTEMQKLEERIEQMSEKRELRRDSIARLENKIEKSSSTISSLNEDLDQIEVMGTELNKSFYNTVVWSIIAALLILLLFFITRYRSTHGTIKEQRATIAETERELEDTRQKAIEKEQKMGRMLQDERNKNRNGGV